MAVPKRRKTLSWKHHRLNLDKNLILNKYNIYKKINFNKDYLFLNSLFFKK